MERRVRLVWSPRLLRPWCPGASLPRQTSQTQLPALTGFLRVQGLMERIRQRRAGPRTERDVQEPAAPLPKSPTTPADPAPTATDESARERAR